MNFSSSFFHTVFYISKVMLFTMKIADPSVLCQLSLTKSLAQMNLAHLQLLWNHKVVTLQLLAIVTVTMSIKILQLSVNRTGRWYWKHKKESNATLLTDNSKKNCLDQWNIFIYLLYHYHCLTTNFTTLSAPVAIISECLHLLLHHVVTRICPVFRVLYHVFSRQRLKCVQFIT